MNPEVATTLRNAWEDPSVFEYVHSYLRDCVVVFVVIQGLRTETEHC